MMNRILNMHQKPLISVLIVLIVFQINSFSQFKTLSTRHDSVDFELVVFIKNAGFGEITYYFDDVTQNVGTYSYYPTLKISDKLTAVLVADVPNRMSESNFIIIIDRVKMAIVDTLGPFYDSFVDAIDPQLKGNKLIGLKIRFKELQEYEDPYYLIIEYKRFNSKLEKVKTYKGHIN